MKMTVSAPSNFFGGSVSSSRQPAAQSACISSLSPLVACFCVGSRFTRPDTADFHHSRCGLKADFIGIPKMLTHQFRHIRSEMWREPLFHGHSQGPDTESVANVALREKSRPTTHHHTQYGSNPRATGIPKVVTQRQNAAPEN
jgi:hypothetical protein